MLVSPLPRLILIADRFTDDAIAEKTLESVDAGVRWVHLRDHRADARDFGEAAHRLIKQLREKSPKVLISVNRRLETAVQAGLHFHTSPRGPAIDEARRQLPGSSLIGYSAHSIKEGQRAAAEGVDYVFFSPVFPTSSKPGHPGAGVAALQAFCEALAPIPVYALGGITLDQAKTCLNAGAYGIAVLSAILGVDDPAVSTKALHRELTRDEGGVRREERGGRRGGGRRDQRPKNSMNEKNKTATPDTSHSTLGTRHSALDIRHSRPVALTIAGSDSGGGAGIQADIKAMQANGVFATTVLTAITAQNTKAVTQASDVPLDLIDSQIDAVCSDFKIAAVKTGMLSSAAIIDRVARKVVEWQMKPLVVDPVMISTSGFKLLQDDAIDRLIEDLIPLASLVTPNTHEAGLLVGETITSVEAAKNAAWEIKRMGPEAVLVKGGHLEGQSEAIDVFYDGKSFAYFTAPYIDTPHTHGTGCTYASAIAANLARGYAMQPAIDRAKRYVTEAIRHGLAIGHGPGPTDHFYFLNADDPVGLDQ